METLTLLDGRVAIVTGSGHGIGRATARVLAAQGARVIVNGIDEQAIEELSETLGGRALPVAADLTQPDAPERLVRAAEDWQGRLDLIVNNAGYNWDSALAEMTDEQFQAMLDIHVLAPFRLLREAAPMLFDRAGLQSETDLFRKVVNVSSVSGTMGTANQGNYCAAKAAIVGLTKGLAKEWGERQVNVNAVAPGFIDTRLTALADGELTIRRYGKTIPLGISAAHRRRGTDQVPLGRPGTVDEVARAILFLCSSWSDYIHGQVISVTGGLTMGMEG